MRSAYDFETDTGMEWRLRAACRGYDPEMWTVASYSSPALVRANEQAKTICRTCPVINECEESAERLGAAGTIVAGREWRKGRAYHTNHTLAQRSCAKCKRWFEPVNNRQVYCREKCRRAKNSAGNAERVKAWRERRRNG